MKLRNNAEGDDTTAAKIDGKLREFTPGITQRDQKPFHQLKLEGDDRDYILYGGGWLELQNGSPVTLHSFRGFETSHDDGPDNYYLDGIEVKDEAGQVVARIRRQAEMVFED